MNCNNNIYCMNTILDLKNVVNCTESVHQHPHVVGNQKANLTSGRFFNYNAFVIALHHHASHAHCVLIQHLSLDTHRYATSTQILALDYHTNVNLAHPPSISFINTRSAAHKSPVDRQWTPWSISRILASSSRTSMPRAPCPTA